MTLSRKSCVCAAITAAVMMLCGATFSAPVLLVKGTGRVSLAAHLLDQVVSRVSVPGKVGRAVGVTDGSNFYQGTGVPILDTNFWLLGVKNILGRSAGGLRTNGILSSAPWVTPISPHIVVSCGHTGENLAGYSFIWVRPDGTFYTNTVSMSVSYYQGGPFGALDMTVHFMALTNLLWLPYFPIETAQARISSGVPIPVIYWRGGNGTINDLYHYSIPWAYPRFLNGSGHDNSALYSGLNVYSSVNSGDSGNPVMVVINNEAVLIGILSGFDLTDYNASAVNAAAAILCNSNNVPVETLTPYDLSRFGR